MSATSAIAATLQGRTFEPPLASIRTGDTPAAVPHRWQNLAPGVRSDRHPAHTAPSIAAPHSAQNRPLAGAEQLGQRRPDGVVAEDMGET